MIRVTNWEKYQHYGAKDGPPPWIKLYRQLLRDHEFMRMPETERWTLIGLWLLASETGNAIEEDATWIRNSLNLRRAPDLEYFVAKGFLERV